MTEVKRATSICGMGPGEGAKSKQSTSEMKNLSNKGMSKVRPEFKFSRPDPHTPVIKLIDFMIVIG